MSGRSARQLAIRRFIAVFVAATALFGGLAYFGGHFDLVQSSGIVLGTALGIAVVSVLLGAFLDNMPRSK